MRTTTIIPVSLILSDHDLKGISHVPVCCGLEKSLGAAALAVLRLTSL